MLKIYRNAGLQSFFCNYTVQIVQKVTSKGVYHIFLIDLDNKSIFNEIFYNLNYSLNNLGIRIFVFSVLLYYLDCVYTIQCLIYFFMYKFENKFHCYYCFFSALETANQVSTKSDMYYICNCYSNFNNICNNNYVCNKLLVIIQKTCG